MKTMHELRVEQDKNAERAEKEKQRLKEKVLCVEIGFPKDMKKALGIGGYTMKLSELAEFLEEEFINENAGTFTVKVIEKTNKWIENLPEADI